MITQLDGFVTLQRKSYVVARFLLVDVEVPYAVVRSTLIPAAVAQRALCGRPLRHHEKAIRTCVLSGKEHSLAKISCGV